MTAQFEFKLTMSINLLNCLSKYNHRMKASVRKLFDDDDAIFQ